jgi:hypothetical protein
VPEDSDREEPDWEAYRKALRRRESRRFSAVGAIFIAVVGLFIIVVKTLEPLDYYPPGDIRNEPLYRVAFAGVALVFIGFAVIGALRAWKRGDKP